MISAHINRQIFANIGGPTSYFQHSLCVNVVAHADEFWVSKRGLNETGTVGTAVRIVVWDPPGNSASSGTHGF